MKTEEFLDKFIPGLTSCERQFFIDFVKQERAEGRKEGIRILHDKIANSRVYSIQIETVRIFSDELLSKLNT